MVDHIDLSGTHHHEHNTDDIGNKHFLDNWAYRDRDHGNCLCHSHGFGLLIDHNYYLEGNFYMDYDRILDYPGNYCLITVILILALVCVLVSLTSTTKILTSKGTSCILSSIGSMTSGLAPIILIMVIVVSVLIIILIILCLWWWIFQFFVEAAYLCLHL